MKNSSVLTIGTFDGVHRGHQKILREAKRLGKKLRAPVFALTFELPPRLFFSPATQPCLLTTSLEKVELLKRFGADRVIPQRFTRAISRIPAEAFFKQWVLGRFRAKAVVVGYDFRFGRGRQGDVKVLASLGRRHGVLVKVVPALSVGMKAVSSGRIRDLLKEGRLGQAARLLGHPYFLTGKVVQGRGVGKGLGFPTANLRLDPLKIVPPGVYAVRVSPLRSGKSWRGMCNVGTRPTLARIKGEPPVSIEAHLFGFSGNLRGKTLKVVFVKKLREEKKFSGLPALKKQLARDKSRALRTLAKA